jgi:hypothetical protein
VIAIQRMQFYAKNANNDLNPTYLVKRNLCLETEGVFILTYTSPIASPFIMSLSCTIQYIDLDMLLAIDAHSIGWLYVKCLIDR